MTEASVFYQALAVHTNPKRKRGRVATDLTIMSNRHENTYPTGDVS
jgi:hypothetical protein